MCTPAHRMCRAVAAANGALTKLTCMVGYTDAARSLGAINRALEELPGEGHTRMLLTRILMLDAEAKAEAKKLSADAKYNEQ